MRGRFPEFNADGDAAEWQSIARHDIKVGEAVVAKVAIAHALEHLWLLAEVEDPSPWWYAGSDPKLAFKTCDALDVLLGPDRPDRTTPIAGDIRVLIAPGEKGPVVMAYRPIKPNAKPDEALKFESPVKSHTFASVMPVGDTQVAFKATATGYVVEVRLSCDHIELKHLTPACDCAATSAYSGATKRDSSPNAERTSSIAAPSPTSSATHRAKPNSIPPNGAHGFSSSYNRSSSFRPTETLTPTGSMKQFLLFVSFCLHATASLTAIADEQIQWLVNYEAAELPACRDLPEVHVAGVGGGLVQAAAS